ncbi:MAG: hypothetical protein HP042_06925 [Lachnospiraceae bacterium]|nr:hypothetical protein [Lachnospiraceae bacterium]
MKKRILAFMMAAAMVFGSSTAVMAADPTETAKVTMTKKYQVNGAEGAQSPAETFRFADATLAFVAGTKYNDTGAVDTEKAVEDSMGIPTDVRTITITGPSYIEGDTTRDRDITTAVITAAKYDSVGRYIYTFKETAGTTAGVTYDNNQYKLYVNVVNGDTAGTYKIGGAYVKNTAGDKVQEIVNTYQSGNLKITKTVTGNMGDKNKVFDVKVTLTVEAGKTVNAPVTITTTDAALTNPSKIATGAWSGNKAEVTLHVKDGTTVELKNLPVGVSYAVAEDAYRDYTTSYTQNGNGITGAPASTAVRGNAIDTVTITNHKDTAIDTGVIVSNLPYILILAAVAGGLVLFAAGKKHRADED